jgi:hypothetical protein
VLVFSNLKTSKAGRKYQGYYYVRKIRISRILRDWQFQNRYKSIGAATPKGCQCHEWKQIYRLWRLLGLCVLREKFWKKPKRRNPIPMLAEGRNHVWNYDFIFDARHNGRRLKILTLEDEFTRTRSISNPRNHGRMALSRASTPKSRMHF